MNTDTNAMTRDIRSSYVLLVRDILMHEKHQRYLARKSSQYLLKSLSCATEYSNTEKAHIRYRVIRKTEKEHEILCHRQHVQPRTVFQHQNVKVSNRKESVGLRTTNFVTENLQDQF